MPVDKVAPLVEAYLDALDLQAKAASKCGAYSGGNKRKLSVALALLGTPHGGAVFLDEPSTGMDPGTRRFLWSFLQATRVGRAVIITTHSMEEADALCDRIGIMIAGALRACGSSQELKDQGSGFSVVVRVEETSLPSQRGEQGQEAAAGAAGAAGALSDLMYGLSKDTKLEHGEGFAIKKYEVPRSDATLGQIFTVLSEAKANKTGGVVDFSVSQTTLEVRACGAGRKVKIPR